MPIGVKIRPLHTEPITFWYLNGFIKVLSIDQQRTKKIDEKHRFRLEGLT
jgi:hypothetical protein